ncbi:MAG: SDR family oxidoreductase [Acidobacteriota bacterium]|nr:SDR family oxidoreductase [Acidobacteriota bacterium]
MSTQGAGAGARNRDPREIGPKPPFPQQKVSHPGSVHDMDPPADHGDQSYTGLGRLKDRVAIITGADSGIGRAVAIAFAREGADVVMSYLPNEKRDAEDVETLIQQAGRTAVRLPGDIGDVAYARSLVDAAKSRFGRLDIVVNNAAYQMVRDSIEDVSPEELEHTFRTNVFGTFFLTQAALPMLEPGAVILNTTSIQTFEPGEGLLAYAATKAAIASLTKSLAKLCKDKGVRVNGIAPGPVWTPLIPATMPLEKVQSFGENTVFGRPAQPVELARLYVFLASEDASYCSGEIFGATGGRTPL